MRPHFCRLADTICNKLAKNNAAAVRGFNQRHYHRIWRPRATTLPSGCSQVGCFLLSSHGVLGRVCWSTSIASLDWCTVSSSLGSPLAELMETLWFGSRQGVRMQVSAQEHILNIQTRALSSVSQGDDIEEDVDNKAAWLMKAFLFGTAVYAGCYFVPLMGDSMIQQSVALLRVKDPLFKRMGASRLSRIATNDDRRRTIVEMGGVHGLVNMLNTAPDDLTRREAMKALASLSQSDIAVNALHHAGAQSVINSITDSTTDDDMLKYKSKLLRRLHELKFLKE